MNPQCKNRTSMYNRNVNRKSIYNRNVNRKTVITVLYLVY